jgi:hypothetical protein
VDIVRPAQEVDVRELPVVTVSDVRIEQESVSFSVDKVGVPVLVKVSHFPNWRVKGAAGIHRAAPNMMVVVPTSQKVELSYRSSGLDRSSYLLTFAGIALSVLFARRRFRYGTAMPARRSVLEDDIEHGNGRGIASENDDD